MSTLSQPYVGVTGITSDRELNGTLGILEEHGFSPGSSHNGMVGFLATKDTPKNKTPQTPRQVENMATLRKLASRTAGRALSVVHYETQNETAIAAPIIALFQDLYAENLCKTAQINGTPDQREIEKIMEVYPEMKLIYQIRPELLVQGVDRIAEEIALHHGAFAYALIDPSCGRGLDVHIPTAIAMHQGLQERLPRVCIGSAGGYSGENATERVAALVEGLGHTQFCVDVEGKVRFQDTDKISLPKVRTYVAGVAAGFSSL